jgi:hypothetical protein
MSLTLRFAILSILFAAPAQAAEADVCADDAEQGQIARDAGRLLDARARFLRCSNPGCPAVVQRSCIGWLDAVDERIPTLVPAARDPSGHDVVDVRVSIDGVVVAESIDGRAIRVDPGRHVVRFERGADHAERIVVAREGERARTVEATIGAPVVAPRPSPSEPTGVASPAVPTASWILFGGSAVALGVSAYAGLAAIQQTNQLRDGCAPRCAREDVESAQRKFLISDVALAIGVATAATGIVVLVVGRSARAPQIAIALAGVDLRVRF